MRKKIFIILLLLLCITGVSYFGYTYYKEATTIHFYIDQQECTEHKLELEYKKNIKIAKEDINLTAIRNKKDISEYIKMEEYDFNELKSYTLNFYIDAWDKVTFPCTITIKDTTPPVIKGKKTYTITEKDAFDEKVLKLNATDLYDQNLTDKITCDTKLDSSKVGTQVLTYRVKDSSGNESTFPVTITVNKKVVIAETPAEVPSYSSLKIVENPNDITVLLNKQNKLKNGWAPNDLVSIGNGHYLRKEAASSVKKMLSALHDEDISGRVISSYRSQSTQNGLYNSYMKNDPDNAPYYSAYPRTSEHELGLAIDISYDSQLHSDLHTSSLGKWLDKHAHTYGWILRYPYNKTHITGYYFEPWHYRYVGIDLATHLKNNNLTLEEYYK